MYFHTIAHIKIPLWLPWFESYWLTAKDLGLGDKWAGKWSLYIGNFNIIVFRLKYYEDELLWVVNKYLGHVTAKDAYS